MDRGKVTVKARDFDHLVNKLKLETREGDHRYAWLFWDNKRIIRTRRSLGRGDLPGQHLVRQQLKLNEEEFRRAVGCNLTQEEYIEILKAKGLLD